MIRSLLLRRSRPPSSLASLLPSHASAACTSHVAPHEVALGSAPCVSQQQQRMTSSGRHSATLQFAVASSAASAAAEPIVFPRERPGLSYALNWSLAAAGVTPVGDVHRNVKAAALKTEFKATAPKSQSNSKVLTVGSGPDSIPPAKFKKLLKEVAAHLSAASPLFVHDGAVGSSSSSDARVRVISPSPSSISLLSSVLTPTPTSTLAASSFPITLYAAPSFSTEDSGKAGFIAADVSSGKLVAIGSAVHDAAALKPLLTAAAIPAIISKGALPLPGRLVSHKASNAIIVAPPSLPAPLTAAITKAAESADVGVFLSPSGAARPFQTANAAAPNLYKLPSALILLTTSSSLDSIIPLSPSQAAFTFLSGFDGSSFTPCYSPPALSPPNPVLLAKSLSSLLSSSSIPAFLISTSQDKDLEKLVVKAISGSAPKEATSEQLTALKDALEETVSKAYPELPSEISL